MDAPMKEADLTFPREKPRSLTRSAAYRTHPVLRRLLGRDRTLRLLLNAERTIWRLAWEAAGIKYGDDFPNSVLALDADHVARWVPAHARVLDVGCGHGRVARLVADRAQSVLGVDHNPDLIRRAEAAPQPPNVRFEVGDASNLDPGEYDLVLLIHVLEHIDDTDALLTTIGNLAPRLIVEVPTFDRGALNPVRREMGLDFSSDDDHVREYTQALLEEQLRRTGWRIVESVPGPISIAALAQHE